MYVDIRLEEICLRVIGSWITTFREVKALPLPKKLKEKLLQHVIL